MFVGYSNTSTSTTGTYGNGTVFRVVISPAMRPPKCADQLWIEQTIGKVFPGPIHPPECARVRRAFSVLGFGPEHPWDPHEARKMYRARARELHPDVGGDEVAFKELSGAMDDLKRREFLR